MLLIDGVKYHEWIPEKEVEEFHPTVKEHFHEIFGNNCVSVEGGILKSEAGIGAKPDWFVISFSNTSEWHIVEAELSSHHLYDHIVNQVGRFINGIKNTTIQRKIIEAIYHEITENKIRKAEIEEAIGSGEIYKFLSDLISKPAILTIIIEKKTPELDEAINLLRYSPIRIVEFQTFVRDGAGLTSHAHIFEPINQKPRGPIPPKGKPPATGSKVTIKNLLDANILKPEQELFRLYKGKRYVAIVTANGKLKLSGIEYNSLSAAGKSIAGSVNGWIWWHTKREDGTECLLADLWQKYEAEHR